LNTDSPFDERHLVERAQAAPDGFSALYRHYLPRVYAYIAYRVGHAHDAEDVVAEVFLRVVESLHKFDYRGAGSFTAWIFSIARNQVADFHRRRQITTELSLEDVPDIKSDDFSSPEAVLARKERFTRLHQMIAMLSPRRQEIITLRFFGELRNQEIAAVLGLDERTVASHLCRALEDLGQRYRHELDALEGKTL
jgi:RNA polymerase sigma-70 factor, ECF subfamily